MIEENTHSDKKEKDSIIVENSELENNVLKEEQPGSHNVISDEQEAGTKDSPRETGGPAEPEVTGKEITLEEIIGEETAGQEIIGEETAGQEETEEKGTGKTGKKFRWLKRTALVIVIILASLAMTFVHSLWKDFTQDESYEGRDITVEIPKNSSSRETAKILQESGVIKYKSSFLVRLFFSEYRGKLRYGTFQLNDGMCLDDVIACLSSGGAVKKEESFTVPEGYSVEMIADKLEKEKIMSSNEFLEAVNKAAANFAYADQLPAGDKVFYQLQGYLFPDTYSISEDMTGDQLVNKMLDNFQGKFGEERQQKAQKMGLSVEEVLIRASMIQKETQIPAEYPVIAGVINNRLAKNMKLQLDSTTVYAMTDGMYGVSRVTYGDLELESPYNTYYVKGLPPGPICNPGLEAIDGVLNPQTHNYLYFQMDKNKNDGSNLFFETYEEHSAASASTAAPEEKTTK